MLLLCLLLMIAAIFIHYLLPIVSSSAPVFTDFVLENISNSGLNKNGELHLFWFVTFGGLFVIAIVLFFIRKIQARRNAHHEISDKNAGSKAGQSYFSIDKLLIFVTGAPFLVYWIAFGQFSIPLCFLTCLSIITNLFFKNQVKEYFLTYVLTYYANMAVLTICCFLAMHFSIFGFADQISSNAIYVTTLIIGTALCAQRLFSNEKIIGVLQMFLPGLLFVWLMDQYLYNQNLITVPYTVGYYVFFIILIILSIALLIKHNICYVKKGMADCIHFLTPMLVFAYHSFSASPMYAQPDQHHHGEQMIPWNQIFSHGQSLYETYTPVSGLFPFTNGFIQHVLLGGTITDYTPAISITMLLVCFLTMFLIYKHVGGFYSVTCAILFILPCYNRQYLVLPVLLLLTLPSLYKKPYHWFFSYISCCFLAGLYYPLYGAGLLIGFLPMAVVKAIQVVKLFKVKKSDSDKYVGLQRKKGFVHVAYIIPWVLLLAVICISIPLLFHMLKHILTYSSQTVMADGIALLGQTSPSDFLPILGSHDGIRQFCYISLRFLLPALGIWIIGFLIIHFLLCKNDLITDLNKDVKSPNYYLITALLAAMISLCISYTYTLVRADVDKVLSRTGPVLIAVCGMFIPVLIFSFYKNQLAYKDCNFTNHDFKEHDFDEHVFDEHVFDKRDFNKYNFIKISSLLILCICLPFMIYMKVSWTKNPDMWVYPDGESQLVMDDADKLFSYYEVPSTFVKSEDTGLSERYQELLGRGFMVSDQIDYITSYAKVVEKCEAAVSAYNNENNDDYKLTFMAFDGQGFFDYLGVTCYGTGYIPAARSYDAQMEIWNSDLDSGCLPVVFYIQPEYDYYIYRQMIANGYVYDSDDKAFYPPAVYEMLNSDLSETNSEIDSEIDLGDKSGIDSDLNNYRYDVAPLSFGGSCATFGASYDSLLEILDATKVAALSDGTLPEDFLGADFDAIYLDVDFSALNADNATLTITWSDSSQKSFEGAKIDTLFSKDRSKLLIPIGMNACWSLSEIANFQIEISDTVSGEILYQTSYKELMNEGTMDIGNEADFNGDTKTDTESGSYGSVIREMKLHSILLKR